MRNFFNIYFAFITLIILFLVFFPFYVLFSFNKKLHKFAYKLNHYYSILFFKINRILLDIQFEEKLEKNTRYIFCPNHMSILDIPTVPLIDKNIAYVGKSEVQKIPLFGYVFKTFHIPVDRQNFRSRYNTISRSKEELDKGKNLAIFPEGGIITTSPPKMARFKDGPFRIAIEKQVSIVPVTIPFNWIILPDHKKLRLNKRNHKLRIIVHQPISTNGMTLDDLDNLKKTTFDLIDLELKKQNRK